ncbi:MAG: flagellar biosynthesis protein FlhF [Planctomycetota bacterium]
MIVRSYTGRTMGEALEKVRSDLGERALIVETRSIRDPGLLSRRTGFEVVAASERARAEGPTTATRQTAAETGDWRAQLLGDLRTGRQAARPTAPAAPETADNGRLGDELGAIRRQLARLAAGTPTPTAHLGDALARRLEDVDTPIELIAELDEALARAGDRLTADQHGEFLARFLARDLSATGGIDWDSCRQLLMVGPTGVGKTTSIAKLAGDLVLRRKRRVALVTIDTYRVGATDQLQAYADLLDAPFAVARTPARLKEILADFADYDNVLIDTAGRNPRDEAKLQELRGFCRCVSGLEVMLAVPATCGRAEFAGIVERFSMLPLQHAVVTKLDENVAPGRLFGCLRRHRLPLDYVTTGQEVPTDFTPADPLSLARMTLGQVFPCSG